MSKEQSAQPGPVAFWDTLLGVALAFAFSLLVNVVTLQDRNGYYDAALVALAVSSLSLMYTAYLWNLPKEEARAQVAWREARAKRVKEGKGQDTVVLLEDVYVMWASALAEHRRRRRIWAGICCIGLVCALCFIWMGHGAQRDERKRDASRGKTGAGAPVISGLGGGASASVITDVPRPGTRGDAVSS